VKCRVRAVTGLNFLLVLRSGRWRKRTAVGRGQREVALVDVVRRRGIEDGTARVAGVHEQVLVAGREALAQLPALRVEVDHDLGEEVLLAEHLVHEQPQVRDLVVVDADEDRAALAEHLTSRLEPRPHEGHPGAVAAEVVAVGELVAGVVRRVDVDQVDGRQRRQHVEVVALDEGVPRHGSNLAAE